MYRYIHTYIHTHTHTHIRAADAALIPSAEPLGRPARDMRSPWPDANDDAAKDDAARDDAGTAARGADPVLALAFPCGKSGGAPRPAGERGDVAELPEEPPDGVRGPERGARVADRRALKCRTRRSEMGAASPTRKTCTTTCDPARPWSFAATASFDCPFTGSPFTVSSTSPTIRSLPVTTPSTLSSPSSVCCQSMARGE